MREVGFIQRANAVRVNRPADDGLSFNDQNEPYIDNEKVYGGNVPSFLSENPTEDDKQKLAYLHSSGKQQREE